MSRFGRALRPVNRLRRRLLPRSTNATPYSFAMLSHPGRVRKGNEDACAVSVGAGAFVVCDGMGGAAAGEIASRMAADTFLEQLQPVASPARRRSAPADSLPGTLLDSSAERAPAPRRATPDLRMDAAIHAANQAVFQHARRSPPLQGMGTTLVGLLLELPADLQLEADLSGLSLTLAHVGDSRCYLFRQGMLTLLTVDHSLVEEQVRSGQITAAEAEVHPMRNIITRAVGSQPTAEPEIRHLNPKPGDLYLLASDGLTRELSDHDLLTIFRRAHARHKTLYPARPQDLDSLCQILVDEANDAGGKDNITVLLLLIH